MSEILITNANILTMDAERSVFIDGAIFIKNDIVLELGKLENFESKINSDINIVDVKGNWVLPGLINTHVHTSQHLARGIADDVDLLVWLRERIWPYESNLNEEDSYSGGIYPFII